MIPDYFFCAFGLFEIVTEYYDVVVQNDGDAKDGNASILSPNPYLYLFFLSAEENDSSSHRDGRTQKSLLPAMPFHVACVHVGHDFISQSSDQPCRPQGNKPVETPPKDTSLAPPHTKPIQNPCPAKMRMM